VTGTWTPGGTHAPPSGEVDSEGPINSGNTGCIVFSNLDTTAGEVYSVSLSGNPTLVSDQEYSDNNPNGALTIPSITLQAGEPKILTVIMNSGADASVVFTGPVGDGGACPTTPTTLLVPATTSAIPISVENSFLTSYTKNTWVAYAAGGSSPSALMLFPWTGTTDVWAGSQSTSSPTAVYGTSPSQPVYGSNPPNSCTVATAVGTPTTMYLPLYPLTLRVTSGAPASLTATEVSGSAAKFNLFLLAGVSATSLPLGEYSLSDPNGALTPQYVWVTPTGECQDTTVDQAPPATCTGASISVSAP
jgi:hypothetical protein